MLLECVEQETGPAPAWTVLWLHGLGADGHDFAPIVPELVRPHWPALRFVFPHAPVRPVTINGGMRMRAWYDIVGMDFATRADASGIEESVRQVEVLIAREGERGTPPGLDADLFDPHCEHLLVRLEGKDGARTTTSTHGVVLLQRGLDQRPAMRYPVVAGTHHVLAVLQFQPAHDEVAARHVLVVVGEHGIERCASGSADDRYRLRGELLGDHHAEARGDLLDQLGQQLAGLLRRHAQGQVAAGDHAPGQLGREVAHDIGGEATGEVVAGLAGIVARRVATQREHLQAGLAGAELRQVEAFAARDVGHRANGGDHDRIRVLLTRNNRLGVAKLSMAVGDWHGYSADSAEMWASQADGHYTISGHLPPNEGQTTAHQFQITTQCLTETTSIPRQPGIADEGAP